MSYFSLIISVLAIVGVSYGVWRCFYRLVTGSWTAPEKEDKVK